MTFPRLQARTLAVLVVVLPLLALFVYVGARSGPLAPVKVTVSTVESRSITPAVFGIGTVQARYTYRIGATVPGRIATLNADVGDRVSAGQLLGELDGVDLDERLAALQAGIKSSQANLRKAETSRDFARAQVRRYDALLQIQSTSEEVAALKRQELAVAEAVLVAAKEDTLRLQAEREALQAQRNHLRLLAPAAGLVVARHFDPGTTVLAGQAVVEIIDPASLWVHTRFDLVSAEGLAAGLPAEIVLRSAPGSLLSGRVLRIEPLADEITEELLAKVAFTTLPPALPPVGELAEVTVQLAALPATPVISNAAVRSYKGQRGVWKYQAGGLEFVPLQLGRSDLQGHVQVLQGLAAGDQVVLYSEKVLSAGTRIDITDQLTGQQP